MFRAYMNFKKMEAYEQVKQIKICEPFFPLNYILEAAILVKVIFVSVHFDILIVCAFIR